MNEGDIIRQVLFLLMEPDDAAVDLDAVDMPDGLGQWQSKGGETDADLDDDVVGTDLTGPDNGLGGMPVDQKILAELLIGRQVMLLQRCSGLSVS